MLLSMMLPALFGSVLAAEFTEKPLSANEGASPATISSSLFSSLERFSRLVDISYCVGTTGLSHPFSCVSRCRDFPHLELDTTWYTGPLMSDSCGFIAVDHGHGTHQAALIVAFRGTYSLTNAIVDLTTIPQEYAPYPGPGGDGDDTPLCRNCTVHRGFWESWNNTRTQVVPRLEYLRRIHPDYPIQLLGHSLGGAVAALAAIELKVSMGWQNIMVTTFGEPRVGNQELAHFIDQVFDTDKGDIKADDWRYRRLTHVDDPVPLLPFSEWGFRPHAGEIFISKLELAPSTEDLVACVRESDPKCSSGQDDGLLTTLRYTFKAAFIEGIPVRFRFWQVFLAHRDYFWRLGLCIPGGDPADWGRVNELYSGCWN